MKTKKSSKTKLRVLFLEDLPQDIEIIRELLMEAEFDLDYDRTDSEKEFLKLLHGRTYDIILADFKLPGFDAFTALRWSKEICPDVPFICVSGTIGEETAVEVLKQGAVDYVLKDRMGRLPFAIKRALAEAKEMEKRKRVEEVVRESNRLLAEAQEITHLGGWEYNALTKRVNWTAEVYRIHGVGPDYDPSDVNRDIGFYAPEHAPVIEKAFRRAVERGEPYILEIELIRVNGERIWVRTMGRPVIENGKVVRVSGNIMDITERKRAEEVIRASLVEKEVLLKEVHHRVKNNLMIIIGLIKMQETKADNVIFSDLLQELEGRVRAMAQVHESLHKSKDLACVDLQNYIETMSAKIHTQFGADRDIRFSVQAVRVEVGLDLAVPCGLILNELITNACKHAFPAGQPGEIRISFSSTYGTDPRRGTARCAPTNENLTPTFELTVADNGIGLPAKVNWKNPETVGLQLVKMLSQQLNGSIEVDRSTGTVFSLKFPVPGKIH